MAEYRVDLKAMDNILLKMSEREGYELKAYHQQLLLLALAERLEVIAGILEVLKENLPYIGRG